MIRTTLLFLFFVLAPLFFPSVAFANTPPLFRVLKVVDGDTIVVDVRGNKETVRLLGIDTPESVDPRRPVQCFGKEATKKLKSFVADKSVILIDDPTQGNRDKYRRLLRYVYLPDAVRTFVNGEMVKQGYAFSYKEYPTKMLEKFNKLEQNAREKRFGLWGSCPNEKPKSAVRRAQAGFTNTSGGDKDCANFITQSQAQAFFERAGPGDPHRLDSDNDGKACETLP